MGLDHVTVKLRLPLIGEIEGQWRPDEAERLAAWEMYVELVTRIAVVELQPDEGSLREALSSLYSLFATTRLILRKYGPDVAKPKRGSTLSFGYLAVAVLNSVLRPVLAKWHPMLLDYESRRSPSISLIEHEMRWDKGQELRNELARVRSILIDYAKLLADVAGVPPLVIDKLPEGK